MGRIRVGFLLWCIVGFGCASAPVKGTASGDNSAIADAGAPQHSPARDEPFSRVAALVRDGKYESAYELLNERDPDNRDPDVVLEKIRIAMKYFVMSINHEIFALTDLEPGQQILKVRGTPGSYDMHPLRVAEVLTGLMKEHPTDYRLQKMLGVYRYELRMRYPGMEVDPQTIIEPLRTAHEHGESDYQSLEYLATMLYGQSDQAKALEYYELGISKRPGYPVSNFNAAVILSRTGETSRAIEHARQAFIGYGLPEFQQDEAAEVAPRD